MRPVLANLGFILQIAGLLMVIPIAAGFYYRDTLPLISFFITSLIFFGSGFLLNAFCVRKELDIVYSSMLLCLVFVILGVVGAIPYLYSSVFQGSVFSMVTHSVFESVSGYTTTGFTLVPDIDLWPKSLILYRGLTQWIGGIGIVFILLAFFYPSTSLTVSGLATIVGIDKIGHGIKKFILNILFIYTLLVILFAAALYLLGLREIHQAVSIVFAAVSTGGFSPVTDFSSLFTMGMDWILIIAMFAGATNFLMLNRFVDRKFKYAFKWEFITFIGIILLGFLAFFFTAGLSFSSSFLHVVSASTTTGFQSIDLSKLSETAKLILMFLMFVGGMSVSTAGGIKVFRLMLFIKFIPWSIQKYIFDTKEPFMIEGEEITEKEIYAHFLVPVSAILLIFISTMIFTSAGFKFIDSLFEVISAFSTTGLSANVAAAAPDGLKWLLAGIMILGRIEILPLLIILTPRPKA